MEDSVIIRLSNFQKWEYKEIELFKGLNLISGPSGSGKSTIARAIHFCLYGGRKYKLNLCSTKKKNIFVEIMFKKNNFSIKRERPGENITVTEGQKVYKGESAQAIIESKFGTEESWISSSYLGQEKDNFFMGESNAKKKELLNEIVFGKSNSTLDPDIILESIKNKINDVKMKANILNETIKIRNQDLDKMEEKYSGIQNYDEISDQKFKNIEDIINEIKGELKDVENKIHDKKKYQKYLNRNKELEEILSNLTVDNETNIDLVQEKLSLKEKLLNFNSEILSYSQEEVYKNKSLYESLYSNGKRKNETIEQFRSRVDEHNQNYNKYLEQKAINDNIEQINRIIELENQKLASEYTSKQNQYENYLSEKRNYEKIKFDNQNIQKEIERTIVEKIEDDDDETVNYCYSKTRTLELATKELNCPHCGVGLIFDKKNENLVLGNIKSKEEKDYLLKKLELTRIQIENRKKLPNLEKKIIALPQEPTEVEKPEKPEFKPYEKTVKLYEFPKPKIFEIETPSMTEDQITEYFLSIKKLKEYERYKELESIDTNVDLNKIKSERRKFKELSSEFELNKKILLEYNFDDKDYEVEKRKLEDELYSFEDKRFFYQKVNEYIDLDYKVIDMEKNYKNMVCKIDEFQNLYYDIENIARDTVDSFISNVNTYLQDICNKLFDRPMEIVLQTTKELKTTKESKATINIYINYDGIIYDNPSDLSGGEKKRVSLALLLAFMKNNPSKLCILDEVLPSMDEDLKNKALEVIVDECWNKFVINICHGISEGKHNNVINILQN